MVIVVGIFEFDLGLADLASMQREKEVEFVHWSQGHTAFATPIF